MSARLTRRRFLGGLVVALAWVAGPARAGAARAPRVVHAARPGTCALGRAYLARHPEEADPARLERLLAPARREGLATRARWEFARGDVVQVRGFLLARSEARFAARAALAAATRNA